MPRPALLNDSRIIQGHSYGGSLPDAGPVAISRLVDAGDIALGLSVAVGKVGLSDIHLV